MARDWLAAGSAPSIILARVVGLYAARKCVQPERNVNLYRNTGVGLRRRHSVVEIHRVQVFDLAAYWQASTQHLEADLHRNVATIRLSAWGVKEFTVDVYPHNHRVGAGVLESKTGRAASKIRWAQRLSGIDPDSNAAALSLMIVARKSGRSYACDYLER